MNRIDAVPGTNCHCLSSSGAFFPFPDWWIRRRSAMLWSDRLVMIDNNNNSNNDRNNQLSKKKIPFEMVEMMTWQMKIGKECQHQFRNFTL
jgi:hypothetical protein